MKLHQLLAAHKATKATSYSRLSELHALIKKPALFEGFSRVYKVLNDDGDILPSEKKQAQRSVAETLTTLRRVMSEPLDGILLIESTNMVAKADIVVDGTVVAKDVPATVLLALEKQVTDLETFFTALPILDEAEVWHTDAASGLMRTFPSETRSTRKVETPLVLYEATPQHPAQTKTVTTDIMVGTWHLTRLSGAISRVDREALVERAQKLGIAIKIARAEANGAEVVARTPIAASLFDFLLT
jgi:hypothetical protein